MVTQKQALASIRSMGAKVTVRDKEYRVNVPGGTEGTAYYTSDANDAVGTARQMMIRYKELHHKKMSLFGARF